MSRSHIIAPLRTFRVFFFGQLGTLVIIFPAHETICINHYVKLLFHPNFDIFSWNGQIFFSIKKIWSVKIIISKLGADSRNFPVHNYVLTNRNVLFQFLPMNCQWTFTVMVQKWFIFFDSQYFVFPRFIFGRAWKKRRKKRIEELRIIRHCQKKPAGFKTNFEKQIKVNISTPPPHSLKCRTPRKKNFDFKKW